MLSALLYALLYFTLSALLYALLALLVQKRYVLYQHKRFTSFTSTKARMLTPEELLCIVKLNGGAGNLFFFWVPATERVTRRRLRR